MHGNSSDGSRWNAVDVDLFVDVGTAVLARTWVQWSRSESCEFCDRSRLSTESPSSRFVYSQGDHLSGKPGNVREFDSCQGNVRDFSISQGNVREKILSGKSCLKLFTVSCIFASIRVFSTSTDILWVTLNMPSAAEDCRELSGNCQWISHKSTLGSNFLLCVSRFGFSKSAFLMVVLILIM